MIVGVTYFTYSQCQMQGVPKNAFHSCERPAGQQWLAERCLFIVKCRRASINTDSRLASVPFKGWCSLKLGETLNNVLGPESCLKAPTPLKGKGTV